MSRLTNKCKPSLHRSTYPGVSTYFPPENSPERGSTETVPMVETRAKVQATLNQFLQWKTCACEGVSCQEVLFVDG